MITGGHKSSVRGILCQIDLRNIAIFLKFFITLKFIFIRFFFLKTTTCFAIFKTKFILGN